MPSSNELMNRVISNEKSITVLHLEVANIKDNISEITNISQQTRDSVLVIAETIKQIATLDKDIKKVIEEQKKFKEEVSKDKGKLMIIIPILMLILSFFITFGLRTAVSKPSSTKSHIETKTK